MDKAKLKKYEQVKSKILASTYGLYATEDFGIMLSTVEDLRHELAMHLDDGSTKECPGCYMKRVWERQIKELKETIKLLRKKYKISATALKSLRKS